MYFCNIYAFKNIYVYKKKESRHKKVAYSINGQYCTEVRLQTSALCFPYRYNQLCHYITQNILEIHCSQH